MKQLTTLFLTLLSIPIFAQNAFPKAELDKVISALIEQYKIPNSVVAITNKDSIIYTFSTPNNNVNDVFLIGSNTKSFTALAVLQLADKGLIDIDKPVSNYLNGFHFANENNDHKITVRHLLNQTSGIPTWAGFYAPKSADFDAFQKEYEAYLTTLPSAHDVGSDFLYSNANYTLLGLIIQKISGKTYANYVSEFILNPLNMTHSFATYKSATANGLINSYQYVFISPMKSVNKEFSDFQVAEGRLASNAADMSQYLRAIMHNSKAIGLKDSTYQMMLTPAKDGYAMGWGETHYFSQKVVQHLGLNENFNAAMFFMPQQDYGVIALANVNSMEFSAAIKEALIKTLLNKPYTMAGFNMELVQRIATLAIMLFALLFFFIRLNKWKNAGFSLNSSPKISGIILCLCAIGLSCLPLIVVPKLNNITLPALIQYTPDYAYGFIAIAVLGTLNALLKLFTKA
jgi:CubicO group peptidase (beta-lactamase class C family)